MAKAATGCRHRNKGPHRSRRIHQQCGNVDAACSRKDAANVHVWELVQRKRGPQRQWEDDTVSSHTAALQNQERAKMTDSEEEAKPVALPGTRSSPRPAS